MHIVMCCYLNTDTTGKRMQEGPCVILIVPNLTIGSLELIGMRDLLRVDSLAEEEQVDK